MVHQLPALPTRTLPVIDMDRAIAMLPARVRADLAWTRPAVSQTLLRLRQELLTEDLVASVTVEVLPLMLKISSALYGVLASNPAAMRVELTTWMNQARESLTRFFAGDPAAIDTLFWTLELFRSFVDLVLPWLHITPCIPQPLDSAVADLVRDPGVGRMLRGQVLFAALEEAAKANENRERTSKLLDMSFLELCRGSDALRELGIFISPPFANETSEQRASRILRHAESIRSNLDAEDEKLFEEAKLQRLR